MNRDEAWDLVCEFVKNENLRKHMLAVEAAMEAYAKKFAAEGEKIDVEQWKVTALLHDFDWEIHPSLDKHPTAGAKILRERGVDEQIVRAVLSHANHTGVERDSLLEKALFACDELTGLIVATALVRPNKSLAEVDVKAIKKKFKQPAFAAGVNRKEVEEGAIELGVNLWEEHVVLVLTAMQGISDKLGL